ncbi:hypothetical protein BJV78DRAFT_1281750 [Lactifluus subvellereus]|nr:hypothetical protein BJV78DRAFT_1281750 [Lactifluus subvellereus]
MSSATKRASASSTYRPWFDRTAALLAVLDLRSAEVSLSRSAFVPPSSMTLRARKQASASQGASSTSLAISPDRMKVVDQSHPAGGAAVTSSSPESTPETSPPTVTKKTSACDFESRSTIGDLRMHPRILGGTLKHRGVAVNQHRCMHCVQVMMLNSPNMFMALIQPPDVRFRNLFPHL